MRTYFAIGHKEDDSAYGVWFPDVEGCFGAGDTYDAALKDASEALRAHIELLMDMDQEVPEPRSIDEVLMDPEAQKSQLDPGAFIMGVPLILPKKVKKRVSFNADAGVVEAVDRQVSALGLTKTDWWLLAAHQMLGAKVIEEATPPKKQRRSRRTRRAKNDDNCLAA